MFTHVHSKESRNQTNSDKQRKREQGDLNGRHLRGEVLKYKLHLHRYFVK